VKARGYSARLGADSLQVVPISQAQARQRSGRAGALANSSIHSVSQNKAFYNSAKAGQCVGIGQEGGVPAMQCFELQPVQGLLCPGLLNPVPCK
jgi:hypothetical protein